MTTITIHSNDPDQPIVHWSEPTDNEFDALAAALYVFWELEPLYYHTWALDLARCGATTFTYHNHDFVVVHQLDSFTFKVVMD